MNTRQLLFFLFLLVVGCEGGLHQNPLHEYPDYIQNATLPDNIPKKPPREPISSEFARIITNDPWAMVVGQSFSVGVDAYLFLEDEMYQDFRVELTSPPPEGEDYSFEEVIEEHNYGYESVEDEEGEEEEDDKSVLKQKEYLFQWTPSQSILDDDIRKVYYLTFTLITDGDVALVRNKTIPVFIARRFEVPKITRVKLPVILKEGESGEMTIFVEAPDSSEMHAPTLQFESPAIKTHSDLRSYINFVEKKWLENGKWEFKYFIDLPKGVDISVTHKKHSLRVRAISAFGIRSDFTKAEVTVNNAVQDPTIAGPRDVTIVEGGRTNIFLSAFDPTLSGEELKARLITPVVSLPGEVFLSYLPMPGGGLEISINWFLPEGVENLKDSYRVEIEVENRGREGMRIDRKKKRYFVNVHVEKLPVPVEEEIISEETLQEDGDEVAEKVEENKTAPEDVTPPSETKSDDDQATDETSEEVEEEDKSTPEVVTPPSGTGDDDQLTDETSKDVEENKIVPEVVTPPSETKSDDDQSADETSPEEGASQNEDLTTPPLSAVRIMPFYNLKERGLS